MYPIVSPITVGDRSYNRAFLKPKKQFNALLAVGKVDEGRWIKQGVVCAMN